MSLLATSLWRGRRHLSLAGTSRILALHSDPTNLVSSRSFIIQLGGALMTLGDQPSAQQNGLHIYTGGVCLQETVILIFLGLGVIFYRRLVSLSGVENLIGAKKLIIALYVSLALISVSPSSHHP